MICRKCRKSKHKKCENTKHISERPTWCDCQHRVRVVTPAELRAVVERLSLLPNFFIEPKGKQW